MINSNSSKTSFKMETVLGYALVKVFTKMEESAQFSSMETNGRSITSKKVLKGGDQTYSQLEH